MNTHGPKMGMEMMSEMLKNMMKDSGIVREMCVNMMERMMGSTGESMRAGFYAPSEIRGLFEEWLRNLEAEVIDFLKEKGKATLSDISEKLKISKESVIFLIAKLAKEGKLEIREIGVV